MFWQHARFRTPCHRQLEFKSVFYAFSCSLSNSIGFICRSGGRVHLRTSCYLLSQIQVQLLISDQKSFLQSWMLKLLETVGCTDPAEWNRQLNNWADQESQDLIPYKARPQDEIRKVHWLAAPVPYRVEQPVDRNQRAEGLECSVAASHSHKQHGKGPGTSSSSRELGRNSY